jgi:Ca-activated chloride channel homolog
MKVKTVGALAALAMMCTSVTVWSVTPQGGFGDRVIEEARVSALEAPEIELDSWRFESGSTLMVEGRLGHQKLEADRDNETYLYLDVKAPAGNQAVTQAPVNLAVVIDRSGSMSGKRLDSAVDAARGMIQQLRDGDVVSVVTYNTEADTIVAPTTIDNRSRQRVAAELDNIVAAGDTCISCGLEAGMAALRGRDGMVQRMLLLSDGKATNGVRDLAGFERLATRARDMGCSISSLGIDVGYNERIMGTLAQASNGRHYFVENASSLPTIFDQERQSLIQTVATNAEVRVDLAPGVQVLQVFDRAFRREGNTLVVPMGSFASLDDKTVLVKVRVPRGAEGRRPVANVSLGFDDLVKGSRGQCEGALTTALTAQASDVSSLDPLVGARVGRAETSATLREANALFGRGKFAAAKKQLTKTRDKLRSTRARSAKSAPKPRRAEVDRDFERQLAALDDATTGFASPPPAQAAGPGRPAAAPRPAGRAGAVQVRRNEESAADFAF